MLLRSGKKQENINSLKVRNRGYESKNKLNDFNKNIIKSYESIKENRQN